MEQHFAGKVNARVIIVKEGKILIARDVAEDQLWETIGGRINVGESIEEALAREAEEELGVRIVLGKLIFSEQVSHSRDPGAYLYITFEATLADPDKSLKVPSAEIAEIAWVDKEETKKYTFYKSCINPIKKYWGEI